GESLVATGSAGDGKLSGRLSDVKKPVDRSPGSLHNLVSLLLMQQRRKRRVVQCLTALSRSIFKNLQPISVGA
ncbi:hypothetical protein, partial [Paraburkholderia sp. J7]|uniref:hypothetical protein n=1 Tax=Paraburkholderia sp. J7 TaxID=2805438 RepID=UPI002AB615F7